MRKGRFAALLLVFALLLCGAAPAGEAPGESLPVQIDGLLSARGFMRNGQCLVPVRALSTACAQKLDWSEDKDGLTLQLGPLTASGRTGKQYLTAEGRYVWMPGGWLVRGGELYLPVPALEKLFGLQAELNETGCAFETEGAELLQGGEDYYYLNFPADDFYWLTHIIHAEAGVEPIEGKIGVGNVVMNRIRSELFPNTVYEVIYDTAHAIQFEPVAVGAIHEDPDPESVAAACLVLEGANTVGDSLYFVNPSAEIAWFDVMLQLETTIGRHKFYSRKIGENDSADTGAGTQPGL